MHIAATAARTAIAVATLLGVLTGCGTVDIGGSRPGTPTATEPAMDNLLDPCTDIRDEWLIELGQGASTPRADTSSKASSLPSRAGYRWWAASLSDDCPEEPTAFPADGALGFSQLAR
ncbi:hypothetical protein [Nocardia farcinica]|nr:hypothetical protein [Nocardia farcinica]